MQTHYQARTDQKAGERSLSRWLNLMEDIDVIVTVPRIVNELDVVAPCNILLSDRKSAERDR